MRVTRQVIGYIEPADLLTAGRVAIGWVALGIIEAADSDHLKGYVVPGTLPPQWCAAGGTETAQYAGRRGVFLRTPLDELYASAIVHQPGSDRRTGGAAAPLTMAIA